MTKKTKVIELIQKKGGLTEAKAREMYNIVMETISDSILDGNGISIPNVGKIKVYKRKARKIKIPKIDQKMEVPERLGLKFEIDDYMKEALNN